MKFLLATVVLFCAVNVSAQKQELSFAEKVPEFPGGEIAFRKFLDSVIVYPDSARVHRKEGTVYVYFEVAKDGQCANFRIQKGVPGAPELSAEALRALRLMPKWSPGVMNGRAIKVAMTVPVQFVLRNSAPAIIQCDTITYDFVEEMPVFNGGEAEFHKYLSQNLRWPDSALTGTAYVRFVVKCDGTISDVSCIKGDPYFGAECVRVISAMPVWHPGRMQGKPVNVEMVLPIRVNPK